MHEVVGRVWAVFFLVKLGVARQSTIHLVKLGVYTTAQHVGLGPYFETFVPARHWHKHDKFSKRNLHDGPTRGHVGLNPVLKLLARHGTAQADLVWSGPV